jgi:hypothetical protein
MSGTETRSFVPSGSQTDPVLGELADVTIVNATKSGRCIVCNKSAKRLVTERKLELFRGLVPAAQLKVGMRVCNKHYKEANPKKTKQPRGNSGMSTYVTVAKEAVPSLAPVVQDIGEVEQMSISADSVLCQNDLASGSESTLSAWETSWTTGHVWQDFACLGTPY